MRQSDARVMHAESSLRGRRVVNTRSLDQAPELDDLLVERGALPVSYPCIDIVPPEDPAHLKHALEELAAGAFDWLVFTSPNAVRAVFAIVTRDGRKAARVAHARVAAVGPGTAHAAQSLLDLNVDLEPEVYTAEMLAATLVSKEPGRILLPLGGLARDSLARTLKAHGADVTSVTAYRTILGRGGADLAAMLCRGEVDAIAFTSPSTVDNLAVRLRSENGDWSLVGSTCIVCIGPVTARAAVQRGLGVHVQPTEHTIRGMVDALEAHFRSCETQPG